MQRSKIPETMFTKIRVQTLKEVESFSPFLRLL